MPAYTSTPGRSKAVQAYGGKVTKRRAGVALGPAPGGRSPYYPPTSGGTPSSSSATTSTSSSSRRSRGPSPAQIRERKITKARKRIEKRSEKRERETKRATRKATKVRTRAKRPEPKVDLGLTGKKTRNYGPFSSKAALLKGEAKPSKTGQKLDKPRREDPKIQGPKETRVAKRLAKAARKTQGGGKVPEIVPPKFRKAVAKHGKMLNPALKAAGSNLSGPEYLGKLIQFESGWSPTAENPSSAYGFGQFIDSTAEDFRKRLGVETQDPKRPKQMIKGAAMHASGKHGYSPLYAGYNPGYSDTDPIPSVESGRNVKVGKPKPIPAQVKRKAKRVLGKKATENVIKQAKQPATSGSKPVPLKTMRKHIKFTESRAEVASEQGAPAKTMLTGMNPEMQRALVRLSQQTGIPVRINEGFRTAKRANEFPSGTGSQHHQGNAADVDNNADYSAEDLAKAGLTNTNVAGEPWHFEPLEPGPSSGGQVTGGSATSPPYGFDGGNATTSTTSDGKGTQTTTKKARRRSASDRRRKQLLNEILTRGVGGRRPKTKKPAPFEPSVTPSSERIRSRKVSLGL